MTPSQNSFLTRVADAVTLGAYSARVAENSSRRFQSEAEASYYSGVGRVISSMPPLQPNAGGQPNRTDSPWAIGETDIGNYRFQDTNEIAWERWRSRTLEETNWLAGATMDRAIERTIGTLIVVEPRTGDEEFDAEVKKWLKEVWNTRACDIRNLHTYSSMCHLLFRAKMRDGDGGFLLTEDAQGNPKLQLIEAQRIKNPNTGEALEEIAKRGNQLVDGVEMTPNGAHVAYWISTQQPGQPETFTRVDERDFIYLFRSTRYSNVRGEPAFRGGYWLFDQIVGYLEAVVVAARVGACQAMIAKRRNPGTNGQVNIPGAIQPGGTNIAGQQQQRLVPITPGAINVINTDEEMSAFNPSQPTQSFEGAINTFARFVGIRFGLTLQDILLNFEKVNYSSSKAARIAAKAATDIEQNNFSLNVISRVYQWSISKAVKNGTIKAKAPENFWDHEWLPPTWPSVEPLKDVQADERQVALGVECRTNIAAAAGYDFAKLCEQNGKDEALMKKFGLSTAIAVGAGGNLQPEQPGAADGTQNNPENGDDASGNNPQK